MKRDLKAYLNYFGRGILVILAVLLVVGLVAAAFFYGDRGNKDQSNQPATTEQGQSTATNESTSQPQSSDQSANSGATSQPSSTGSEPNTGPQQFPNTGPEDWAPLAATIVVLLLWHYRKSRKLLLNLQAR